ncbi:PREDICTED: guanylate-binding [Prunus dulcis]|uniref:PREDICTED: guanylate-binding n=1 Tax=Prunus dulcis TaxID=3755 RepID=A0A5E4FBW6_PRUDU|nr:PREDICTED: guanylate-binding [Prunus dulcis]
MFIYNQMGGIDEGSLDCISLVTQMTKHIRAKASGGTTASEIGHFSPIFVWLLRDFYLDLSEDSGRITPQKRDVVAKNEIQASIRALFPDRECFTLVRPLNNEHDLQRLDEIQLDKLRPEFRSGLDTLTRFVFERTRPKQVGATMMMGPVLVGITHSYLDALNKGAVPTISSSWQPSSATPPRPQHMLPVLNEATERKLRIACHASDANIDNVLKVLDGLLFCYEAASHGPAKWQKLTIFLQKGFLEKSTLKLRCRSIEDKLGLLNQQLESSEKSEYLKRSIRILEKRKYEQVISKQKAEEDQASSEIAILKSRAVLVKLASAREEAESAQGEAQEWKRKYEIAFREAKAALEKAEIVQERRIRKQKRVKML